ncbi:hypothetical protein [Mumia zhuanghuii]
MSPPTKRPPLDRERAAARVSAYLYGNILVLAALVSLHPEDLDGPTGAVVVLGTAVSTFIAHALAETVALDVRSTGSVSRTMLLHELRDARPIASTASLPVLLMLAAYAGWIAESWALGLAIAVIVVRLAALGWIVAQIAGKRGSREMFGSGFALAVLGILAAVLEWQLKH